MGITENTLCPQGAPGPIVIRITAIMYVETVVLLEPQGR